MQRAIDFLETIEEVDPQRIGCYGHSMGSTHTWLVGPWEPRLKCLVGNCCLPTYSGIHRTRVLHCFPNFIPGLHQFGDTTDIVSLIVPRPLHFNFGQDDSSSPLEELREGLERITDVYRTHDASDNFSFLIEEEAGHDLTPTMWEKTKEVFVKHL